MFTQLRPVGLAVALAMLGGCAVGPDFHRPAAPEANAYTAKPLPAQVGDAATGSAQQLAVDSDIPAQWWELFHSPALNDLVKRALERNPSIAAAQAALRQARETTAAQRGAYYPSVTGSFNPTRQRIATTLASPASSGYDYYSLHTAELSVSFVPDVFGANRRQVESLAAQEEYQRFQLEATRITLASNVVMAAIQEASLRDQVDATRKLVDAQQKVLDSYRQQLVLGQAAHTDVMAQETQLAQFQATLPPLEKQLAQQRDLLTALVGDLPANEPAAQFHMRDIQLPQNLPVSLPIKLVDQRPDVRSAEAQLHAASAQVGVAIANRLPNVQINGSYGSAATELKDLFKSLTEFWSISGTITQPIFDAGTLKHKQGAAQAAYDQAAAQYRSTVIAACQNVADTLHAIESDADALRANQYAETTAKRGLDIALAQQQLGNVPSITVTTAEQAWLQSRLALINAQANRLSDSAMLIQALGGGWWNTADKTASAQ
ncbi:MAG: efflux transporter outer membrane subunit [Burkholderiales bacterium]|nr:efflux transporter outer membrane subunit [Burkholderiales bacterium]